MTVGDVEVQTKTAAKYLGVVLDRRLTWWEHIQAVCDKAARVVLSLSRLMGNVGGPRSSKRRLLMSTVNAILLYGAELWAGAMRVNKYSKRILSVQRRAALRVACAYRSVSGPAVMVVAGVIPLDLLAVERQNIFRRAPDLGRDQAAAEARLETLRVWQERWDGGAEGRWTSRLIRDISPLLSRTFGEVDFFLCQFLTGHGYFRKYLFRMGKVRSPQCRYCPEEVDDVCHSFFGCSHFAEDRRRLVSAIGDLSPDVAVEKMLRNEDSWRAVALFVQTVLRRKQDEGCLGDL